MGPYVDKLAWAVSLLEGARLLGNGNRIPLFLLLGFAVENALKAYLKRKGEPPGKRERSHDLANLYNKASATGLTPIDGVEDFVRALSPYQKDFVFRYPEKAGIANLFKPASSILATDGLCAAVFLNFDTGETDAIAAKSSKS